MLWYVLEVGNHARRLCPQPLHRSLMATPNSDTSRLKQIEETLWKAADRLRNNLDAAESARLERAIRDNLRSLGYET
jgi:predicted  nucleic acid-binding Zn ribbon protein